MRRPSDERGSKAGAATEVASVGGLPRQLAALTAYAALTGGAVLSGCTGAESAQAALVVLDDEARAAGVAVEIAGEAQDVDGPIAVPTHGEDVTIRHGATRERLAASPGEVVAIEGADARVRRGADAGRLVLSGDAARAERFAELGGMQAIPLPDGRFLIDGENAVWTALLFPDAAGRVSPWVAPTGRVARADLAAAGFWAGGDDGWSARTAVELEEVGPPLAAAPVDLAAYVGAYVSDDVVLVLDAQGGLHMTGPRLDRHGTFGLDHGALVMRFEDGTVRVEPRGDDELRDASGLRFHTMPVPHETPVVQHPFAQLGLPTEGL